MSTRLLLVRHGQSVWNASRRWQGHSDAPLSELGDEQAQEAGAALSDHAIAALYTSDLRRAFRTAQHIAAHHGLVPVVDRRLRELDVGAWGGLTRGQIEARWPEQLAAFDTGAADVRPPGGETLAELEARVHAALEERLAAHAGETVAVVAHGGVLAAVTGEFGYGNAEVVPWEWPTPRPGGRQRRA